MHSNLNNFASEPQTTITLDYLVRTLDAKGIKLTREQFNSLTIFNDQIPLNYLVEYEKIGALTKIIPELNQRLLVSDAHTQMKSRIPIGTPQLPLQYATVLRNHALQQIFVKQDESLTSAYDNEVTAKMVKAHDMYNHKPYYSKTADNLITTGPTYRHVPESRFAANKGSEFFKGLGQSFNIDVNSDTVTPGQIKLTPKLASNVKQIILSDFDSPTQNMTISYRDGGKRVLEFNDPKLAENVNNSTSLYAQTIPQYNPSLANLSIPDLNSSRILRSIFINKNPNKITPQERQAIINSSIYGIEQTRPDINTSGRYDIYKNARFRDHRNYRLLQDSMVRNRSLINEQASHMSYMLNRSAQLRQMANLKRMADISRDHNSVDLTRKVLRDNFGQPIHKNPSLSFILEESLREASPNDSALPPAPLLV